MSGQASPLQLTPLVMSPADVSRLRREMTALDEYLQAQRLREPGTPVDRLPKLSRILDDFMQTNNVNLLHETARKSVEEFLDSLNKAAPILHISFAADPSSASLQKLVVWLRQNVNPLALVRTGLQPTIVAGCVLRTTNRYFDFSLKHYLQEKRGSLMEAIQAASAKKEVSGE